MVRREERVHRIGVAGGIPYEGGRAGIVEKGRRQQGNDKARKIWKERCTLSMVAGWAKGKRVRWWQVRGRSSE